jgi:hypothetical protein
VRHHDLIESLQTKLAKICKLTESICLHYWHSNEASKRVFKIGATEVLHKEIGISMNSIRKAVEVNAGIQVYT